MYVNKHGYSFIQGEFDSTSIYAMEILKSVPFNPCATWITYQKKSEGNYTPSDFFYAVSISNCTVIPLGSTTVNPVKISFIPCCFSINLSFTSSNASLCGSTIVYTFNPVAYAGGCGLFTPFHVFAPIW